MEDPFKVRTFRQCQSWPQLLGGSLPQRTRSRKSTTEDHSWPWREKCQEKTSFHKKDELSLSFASVYIKRASIGRAFWLAFTISALLNTNDLYLSCQPRKRSKLWQTFVQMRKRSNFSHRWQPLRVWILMSQSVFAILSWSKERLRLALMTRVVQNLAQVWSYMNCLNFLVYTSWVALYPVVCEWVCQASVEPDQISTFSNIYRHTSTLLTQYNPIPSYTDPVPICTNQHRPILSQYHQVPTSTAPYWPSTTESRTVSILGLVIQ